MRPTKVIHVLMAITGCGASHGSSTPAVQLAVGAACEPAKEAYVCSADRMEMLDCDARRWRVAGKCAGAEHCVSTASKIKCDDTLGDVGMACADDGDMACARDGSALLTCTKGAMALTSRCRGAKACVVRAGVPTCDRTVAKEGDHCDAEGEAACTVDHDAIVECRSHVMVQTTVCHCRAADTEVRCE